MTYIFLFIKSYFQYIVKKIITFSGKSQYKYFYALFYSLYYTFSFYPGVFYSDSIRRWWLAKYFSEHGFFTGNVPFSDREPVIPSMIMSFFYDLTHEMGFFTLVQSFLFVFVVFFFVEKILPKCKHIYANILVSFVLLLPLNSVYSIFNTHDVFESIFLVFLAVYLLDFFIRFKKVLPQIIIFSFLCVSFRLNTIAVIFPLLVIVSSSMYLRRDNLYKIFIFFMTWIFLCSVPFFLSWLLWLRPYHPWKNGIAHEYSLLAVKSQNPIHKNELQKLNVDFKYLRSRMRYESEWVSWAGYIMAKVPPEKLLSLYFSILIYEPWLFFNEKIQYTKELFGFYTWITDGEMGKWRFTYYGKKNYWLSSFEQQFWFYTSPQKEKSIDNYIYFMDVFSFLRMPYFLFLFFWCSGILLFIVDRRNFFHKEVKEFHITYWVVFLLSLAYYTTFILCCSDYQFRYFLPSLFLLQILFISTCTWSVFIKKK